MRTIVCCTTDGTYTIDAELHRSKNWTTSRRVQRVDADSAQLQRCHRLPGGRAPRAGGSVWPARLQDLKDSLLSFTMTLQPLHDFPSLDLHTKRILVFTDGSHDQRNSETDINNGWSYRLRPVFVTQPCPDNVMPSRAIQPISTSRPAFESCTKATVNVNTLLPNDTVMEEGLLVPKTCNFAGQGNFWRRPSTSLPCKRRTRLAGTIRLLGYTAISTDAGQIARRTIVPPYGTNRFSRFVRISASSQSLPGQKLLIVTSHAPHAQRPHTEIHAWWTRFDELVAAWKLQFSNITLLGDEWTSWIRPLKCCRNSCSRGTEQHRPFVASGTPLSCLLVTVPPELPSDLILPALKIEFESCK